MPAERFDFPNAQGQQLAALLDRPDGEPRAVALFAHCFTCGKHNRAARRIADGLKMHGVAVLRFDFTGLGASEGEFANTTFSSNVDDLVAAADHLRRTLHAPAILIGHSLGGAAVLAAAHRIAEARAVVTIGAPSDPAHVTGLFGDRVADIAAQGEVEVSLAGRPFRIRRAFLDDVAEQNLTAHVAKLRKALLIFHAPEDDIVGIDNASRIFLAAKHPKSFVSLDRRRSSAQPRRRCRLCGQRHRGLGRALSRHGGGRATGRAHRARHGAGARDAPRHVSAGDRRRSHRLLADEPVKSGGLDSGPGPYDLLLAALGACTSMTLRLYADRKKLPLTQTQVRLRHAKIHAADCAECETKEGMIDRIERAITLEGDLDAAQRASLMAIADKCPVHRTLKSEIDIRTVEEGRGCRLFNFAR